MRNSTAISFRHRNRVARLISVIAALAAGLLLVGLNVGPAQAVHDTGMFELDGNVAHDAANTPPYDWGSLFNSAGNRIVTPDPDNGPVLASTFIKDTTTPDPTYFAENKDIEPISAWGCGPINNPTDKDDLQNSYAALIQVPDDAADNAGHKVLYLGSERDSNNGTSFAGFWLLKDRGVGCNPPGDFVGGHTNGDVLIVSDYTNGGGTQDVSVYKWVGGNTTNSTTDNLELIASGGVCGGAATDDVCAIANSASLTTPWSPTSHDTNTFVETGIDLSNVLGSGGCFTTFLSETRSSDQLTATLKDYAGGQFNTCPPAPVTTTASPGGGLNAPGSAQHDNATVSAVGGRPTPTGSIAFYLCDPSEVVGAGCPTGGTLVSTNDLVNGSVSSDAVSGAATTTLGKYCWRAEYTPDAAGALEYVASSHTNSTTECFTVVHGSPTIATQIVKDSINGGQQPGLGFTSLGDTAQLSGFVGSVDGNQVDFALYDVTDDPGCTGAPVFTTTGTLNGSGQASTSASYTPTEAHTYTWIASYLAETAPNDDPLNDDAVGLCTDLNESATIVAAHIDVTKSANPPGPVSAGTAIGFDIIVSNAGSVPATGVTVTDNLPAKADGTASGDLSWTLSPYTGCAITGAVGSQVLSCDLGTVAGSTVLDPIHVQSQTSPADCGVVSNQATVATTNGTGEDSDVAHVTVQCPGLHIAKEADADSVNAGSPIGFTVTASNTGEGTATGVLLNDPLPTGPGITWTIVDSTGPLTCVITDGTLSCTGSLAAGATQTVHVTSPTQWSGSGESEVNSCLGGPEEDGVYPNTAQVSASNVVESPSDGAQTQVLCPDLHVTKTAGATAVSAGAPIGFTITASNTGAGDATGALVNDPLPGGVVWSIRAAGTSGPLTCAISSGVLTCTGTLGTGATQTVQVTAPTTTADCARYDNTGTLTATNTPQAPTASASTTVVCPIVSPPIVSPPQVKPPAALPNTGGPNLWLLLAGLVLVLGGGSLVAGERLKRRRS